MPSIAATAIQWLNQHPPDGYTAHGSTPDPRPERYITIQRTGGIRGRYKDDAMLAIQVNAPTRSQAAATSEQVADLLLDMWQLPEIADVEIHSIADTSLNGPPVTPRYQITAEITTTT